MSEQRKQPTTTAKTRGNPTVRKQPKRTWLWLSIFVAALIGLVVFVVLALKPRELSDKEVYDLFQVIPPMMGFRVV